MKTCVALLTCALPWIALNNPLHAGVITELTAVLGSASPASPPPIPVSTFFVDNDENPALFNFVQLFTALPITGAGTPVDFLFRAVNSGTGGTTEYVLNQWIRNDTGVPWSSMRYSLSAQTTAGVPLAVPGLDFDWPDLTTPGLSSVNFPNLAHLATAMFWSGGTVGVGLDEITLFAIDVPDIGSDYDIVLTLEVFQPGDLNGDGFVGVDDLNIVLVHWNQNVTPGDLLLGDPTGEGFVGVDDLNIVLVNWNNGTPPANGAAIPEPASLLAWPVGLLLLGRCRGRRSGD